MALPRPIPPQGPTGTISNPITPPHSLQSICPTSDTTPVPNKHIPVCPTGPAKTGEPDTPPPSPKQTEEVTQRSILYPPSAFTRIDSGNASIYEIDAAQVAEALEFASRQSLPPPSMVFPWYHGLHPHNHMQQAFFNGRRRASRKSPSCLRAVTLVKADGDLNIARLKGAISPEEFMLPGPMPVFAEADPLEGFSVRNFQIQPAKVALTSDIIVYGEDSRLALKVACNIAAAQLRRREKQSTHADPVLEYNTFLCKSPFRIFEEEHSELVSIDAAGNFTGQTLDLIHQERREMWDMTKASEISNNVYMGPTPEPGGSEEQQFDILIECSDLGRLDPDALRFVAEDPDGASKPSYHDFPSSGSILPPTWSHAEADGILETCKWIYHLSSGTYPSVDADGDFAILEAEVPSQPRKILIHCADGYTESAMLGIAYFSYSSGRPIPDAWLNLHKLKRRNFFAYPSDVCLLTAIAPRLLRESPVCADKSLSEITDLVRDEPDWFACLDGSFPSRILDHLYLGNLGHANNPDLLQELNIRQILSVGETATWREGDMEKWGAENVCIVRDVQDNGIDPLTEEFERCIEFIGKFPALSTITNAKMSQALFTHNGFVYRTRETKRRSNSGALSSWSIAQRYNLYC